MEDVTKRQTDDLQAKLTLLTSEVGAFEGDGYQTNGLYRSQMYCLMGSNLPNSPPQFCVVCRQAVQRMIDYFASGSQ